MKITPVEYCIRVLKEADAEDRNAFAAEVVALGGPSATTQMTIAEAIKAGVDLSGFGDSFSAESLREGAEAKADLDAARAELKQARARIAELEAEAKRNERLRETLADAEARIRSHDAAEERWALTPTHTRRGTFEEMNELRIAALAKNAKDRATTHANRRRGVS